MVSLFRRGSTWWVTDQAGSPGGVPRLLADEERPKTHLNDMARLSDFVGSVDRHWLADVTTADVSRFLDRKVNEGGIGPTTVLRFREILHALLPARPEARLLAANPVSPIPRPRLPEREPEFLRDGQLDRVCDRRARGVP